MIYLDNAATSFYKPPQVVSAVSDALLHFNANPGRSGHELSVKAAEKVFEARETLNDFFYGYGSEFVSFTSNCTQALNIAIKGLLKKGDHVIVSCFEHNSVLRPVHKLKENGIIDYSFFYVYEDEESTLESFRKQFRKNTRLCIVTAVSNVFGNILPLEKLSRIAHENGAFFLVDGAQGAGVVELNMKKQGIDCLCVPGHKGLLGPMGTGAILHNDSPFDTLLEGGTGTQSLSLEQPEAYPERLESGTLNVPGISGFREGVKYIQNKGLQSIFRQENDLASYLFDGLSQIKNVTLYTEKYNSKIYAPVISFNVKNSHSEQVSHLLSKKGIAVRGGFHCSPSAHIFMHTNLTGAVRISPSFVNTKKEINILLNLVEKIAI